jgi:dTDP-4-dehydrorhamnose reductase
MQKLLVTGASGFLGWNLCQIARADWEVHGTYARHSIEIPEIELHSIDLTDLDTVDRTISAIAPDAIIHTAAASQPNFCQNNPELSYRINVTVSQHLAKICQDANIPFVFTSTDLVFDGTKAPYRETDPVAPLNIYGEQKVTAEREILAVYLRASICRMPLMFGMAPANATSFIQPWIKSLQAGESLNLFVDEFRTPVSARTAAQGLLMALKLAPGTIHLGGKDRISRYDFGLLLADVFGFDSSLILPIYQKDLQMAAPRAADVSMDISKALALGYDLPPLRSELEAIDRCDLYNL